MAKRAKPVAKRGANRSKPARIGAGELLTLLDFVRYAASRFVEAGLVFAHGTTDPVAEAAFLVCEALHLHPDQFEAFAAARVTSAEGKKILDLIGRHADEALSRWPLQGLTIIHRFGRIAPGENIVLVVTASSHRQAAFEAAEFLMDYLKTNAPFWKREESQKGTSWVEARDHDDAATARWTKS